MKILSLLTIASAALLLTSCGGSNVSQNSSLSTDSIAPLTPISDAFVSIMFDRVMNDQQTQMLENREWYEFSRTSCAYTGESLAYGGNFSSMGCYPMSDNRILVVRQDIIQHLNDNPLCQDPYFSFHIYDLSTDKLERLSDEQASGIFQIDTAFFEFDNHAFSYDNFLYAEFCETGLTVRAIRYAKHPGLFYSWDGTRFVEQLPDQKPLIVCYYNLSGFPTSAVDYGPEYEADFIKRKGNINIIKDKGKDAFLVEYTSDFSKIKAITILSPRYAVDSVAVGMWAMSANPNALQRSEDGKRLEFELDDKIITCPILDGKISEIHIEYTDAKSFAEYFKFSDPGLCAQAQTILNLLVEINPFKLPDFKNSTLLESFGENHASICFDEDTDADYWDQYQVDFAFYKTDGDKYKVYFVSTKVYDGYTEERYGNYGHKERFAMGAYIYDGKTLTPTECDLPKPSLDDIPTGEDEYDPVGLYEFAENHVSVLFSEAKGMLELEEDEERGAASINFYWTGHGWK